MTVRELAQRLAGLEDQDSEVWVSVRTGPGEYASGPFVEDRQSGIDSEVGKVWLCVNP